MKATHTFIAAAVLALAGCSAMQSDSSRTSSSSDHGRSGMGASPSTSTTATTSTSSGSMSGTSAASSTASARPQSADVAFVNTAAAGGMYEVQAARLGVSRATSPDVKTYAQMLVDHHTQSNAELMSLARAKGVTPPPSLPPAFQAKLDQLSAAQGPAFDSMFVRTAGVQDHMNQIAQFEQASRDVTDPDLKGWIGKTLPVLRQHLQAAQGMAGRMAG